jgi:hypothetical protein
VTRLRVPVAEPCPAELLFPPEPRADSRGLYVAWADARLHWHREHAIAGVSELGTYVDHLRAKTCARLLRLAWRGRLDPRQAIPFPECMLARWDERPAWLKNLPANPGDAAAPLRMPR